MPAEITGWTAAMARALPDDDKRYEVLDGRLVVSPAPSWVHQLVVGAFYRRLYAYIAEHGLGSVMMAPADVEFSDTRLLQPDVFVVPLVNGRIAHDWESVRRLLLVVEVISPSTSRTDRGEKREIYRDERVPEYWIVHPEGRLVERWRSGKSEPEIIDTNLTWQPTVEVPALAIDLQALFDEVYA